MFYYCSDIGSCTFIQNELSECFDFIKTFINDENFVSHVKSHSTELKDIEEKLDQHLLDLKRTDGAIVFAGKFVINFVFHSSLRLNACLFLI